MLIVKWIPRSQENVVCVCVDEHGWFKNNSCGIFGRKEKTKKEI